MKKTIKFLWNLPIKFVLAILALGLIIAGAYLTTLDFDKKSENTESQMVQESNIKQPEDNLESSSSQSVPQDNTPNSNEQPVLKIASNVNELPKHEHDDEYFKPTTDDYVIIGSNQRLKIKENNKIVTFPVVRYELRCYKENGEVDTTFHKYIFQNDKDAKYYHEFQLKNNDVYTSPDIVGYRKATAIRFDNLVYYYIDTFIRDYKDSLELTLSKQWFYEDLGQIYLYSKEHQILDRTKTQSEIDLDAKYIPKASDDFLYVEAEDTFSYGDYRTTTEVPITYQHYTFYDDYGTQIARYCKYICPNSEIAQMLHQRIIDCNAIVPKEDITQSLAIEGNIVYETEDMAKIKKIWEATIQQVTDIRTKDELVFCEDNSDSHYLSAPENFFLQHRSGYVPPVIEHDQNNNPDNSSIPDNDNPANTENSSAKNLGYDWWDGEFETEEKEKLKSLEPIAALSLKKSNSSFNLSLKVIDENTAEECWLFSEYVMKSQLDNNILNKKCVSRAGGSSDVCYLIIEPISKDKAKITIIKEDQIVFEKEAVRVDK